MKSWRSRSFESRCLHIISSTLASSRARTRSLADSSTIVGTRTATSSSTLSSRASRRASRASVLTLSPAGAQELGRGGDGHRVVQVREGAGQVESRRTCFVGDRDGSVVGSDPGDPGGDGFIPAGEFRLEDFTRAGVEGCCADGSRVHIQSDRSTLGKHQGLRCMLASPSRSRG